MTWLYLVSAHGKFDINAHNFWHSDSNSIKVTYLNSSHQNLSNDIFCLVPPRSAFSHCFQLFLVMTKHHYDVISRHTVVKFAYILYRLVLLLQIVSRKFYRQIKKQQWWRHHDVISCYWDLKISRFVELNVRCYLSRFQISWLSGSNFMEFSVRPQNTNMTSFLINELPN